MASLLGQGVGRFLTGSQLPAHTPAQLYKPAPVQGSGLTPGPIYLKLLADIAAREAAAREAASASNQSLIAQAIYAQEGWGASGGDSAASSGGDSGGDGGGGGGGGGGGK